MRAVIVFCEGNHDIAFVTRSMGATGSATWHDKPIRELPSPFGPVMDPNDASRVLVQGVIEQRYGIRALDAMRVRAAAHPPTPAFDAFLMTPDATTLYVLVRSHGDDAAKANLDLLDDIDVALDLQVTVQDIAIAFLFDADDHGLSSREIDFASSYSSLIDGQLPAHATWSRGKRSSAGKACPLGLFVFHDSSTADRTGTLDGILEPIVQRQWPDRWKGAGDFLRAHAVPDDPVNKKTSEFRKAQICTTGQFLCPGDPMSEVLSRRVLPQTSFQGPESRALADFLTSVPW